jgi:2-haloacid dehalogenase
MAAANSGFPVRALLFDVYGTLFDVNSVAALSEELFPGRRQDLSGLWRTKQLEYTYLLSLMGRFQDFWQVTGNALAFACRALGLACPPAAQERLLKQYLCLEPFPDVQEGLQALTGWPLYILSNGAPEMLKAVVENAGLAPFFRRIISASEVRTYKPSPVIYRRGAEQAGQPAPAVGLVSANGWDVNGAKSFGLWGAWLNRRGAPWDDLGLVPDVTVTRLTELADLLKK